MRNKRATRPVRRVQQGPPEPPAPPPAAASSMERGMGHVTSAASNAIATNSRLSGRWKVRTSSLAVAGAHPTAHPKHREHVGWQGSLAPTPRNIPGDETPHAGAAFQVSERQVRCALWHWCQRVDYTATRSHGTLDRTNRGSEHFLHARAHTPPKSRLQCGLVLTTSLCGRNSPFPSVAWASWTCVIAGPCAQHRVWVLAAPLHRAATEHGQ